MNTIRTVLTLSVFVALVGLRFPVYAAAPSEEVDPFLGTLGGGNVFPGPSLPFGYLQPGPDTGPGSSAGGYKFNKPINGFSQQHISGMGGPTLGQFSLMPVTGEVADPSDIVSTGKSAEAATPGYYTVTLAPWNVKVELTVAARVAFHRHTFPSGRTSRVFVDAGHCLFGKEVTWNSGKPLDGEVFVDPARREVYGTMTFRGGRTASQPWTSHFVARFDQAFAAHATWADSPALTANSKQAKGAEIGAALDFAPGADGIVNARVAVSWRSIDQARAHLDGETRDFEQVRAAAVKTWNDTLGRIQITGGNDDLRRQFYTALYRVHLTPNEWRTSEAPLAYVKPPIPVKGDKDIALLPPDDYYENILCLWDTFRTPYPLLTLLQPQVMTGIVNTLLDHHRIKGWTGDAHSVHQYEHVQVGSHADSVIADAYVKNLPGIDWPAAYAAIRKNAFEEVDPETTKRTKQGRFRLADYRRHGYLPADVAPTMKDVTAVSRTLEYAHNDFSVLTLARQFGTPEDIKDLEKRIFSYRNVWDASTGFMRGRNADGTWFEPFDPVKDFHTGKQFYEGHAWTWSWYVPHDVQGLINLKGGDDAFVSKLTTACENCYEAYNEPAMLQTYLFIHAGRPDLTQRFSREALKHFNSTPKGLPGNDDSGTTSGWLVWTLLGLFPNAGQDYYYLGSPSFPEAVLHLANGRRILIKAPATSAENRYVKSVTLNGQPWNQAWLRHADLITGSELVFDMTDQPTAWAKDGPRPPSLSSPNARP